MPTIQGPLKPKLGLVWPPVSAIRYFDSFEQMSQGGLGKF